MGHDRKSGSGSRRRPRAASISRFLLRSALALTLILAGALSIAFIDANWRFARRGSAAPVRLYSAPFLLRDGVAVTQADLAERLSRLGYRKLEGRPRTPGEYSQRFRSFEIALNRFN